MRSFRDMPIRRKLLAISLLSSAVALLLACGGFVAYEISAYRQATLSQLTSVAGVIGLILIVQGQRLLFSRPAVGHERPHPPR